MIAIYVILIFFIVIIVRTILFKPKNRSIETVECKEIDKDKAIKNLQSLIRCKTISYHDKEKEDDFEFEKLIGLLPELFPYVFKECEFKNIKNRALIFHWKGKERESGIAFANVYMAHFDVVPVDKERWDEEPFSGVIKDGIMWGRGTIDTKVTFNGILSAADELIKENFIPENDIYFAFGGNEEINGNAAIDIVDYFVKNDIKINMVIDEGGAVVDNVFPGVKKKAALVGIAEKGLLDVTYTTDAKSGHASAPGPHTSVGVLASALCKVENHPFKMRLSKPVKEMFNVLGRESTFIYRMIFANWWCFGWIIGLATRKTGGELNALLRTTVAFTQMNGSKAPNVIPSTPYIRSNIRINPEESIEYVICELKRKIKNEDVVVKPYGSYSIDPSPISKTNCKEWNMIEKAIQSTWGVKIVSPYLMVQCSDSRHYRDVSDKVYRFSAQALTSEERKMIHGDNERIRLEEICKAVTFFKKLMIQC